jgi:hypothetical protein
MAHDQAGWMARLDAELGNLRAAIAVSLTQPDPEPDLRLAAALRVYWQARGHATETTDVLRALLDLPAAREATLPRARALVAAAYLLQQTGDNVTAESYCEEALGMARAAGDDYLVADLLHQRAPSAPPTPSTPPADRGAPPLGACLPRSRPQPLLHAPTRTPCAPQHAPTPRSRRIWLSWRILATMGTQILHQRRIFHHNFRFVEHVIELRDGRGA